VNNIAAFGLTPQGVEAPAFPQPLSELRLTECVEKAPLL
jgi:hypothetical protein